LRREREEKRMVDAKRFNEAEALLEALEKRIVGLEYKRATEQKQETGRGGSSELVEENAALKDQVKRLEYRILMLTRALKEADNKIPVADQI